MEEATLGNASSEESLDKQRFDVLISIGLE
jgi:hypothetical protein